MLREAIKDKNGGAFPRHDPTALAPTPEMKVPKFYPADDVKGEYHSRDGVDSAGGEVYGEDGCVSQEAGFWVATFYWKLGRYTMPAIVDVVLVRNNAGWLSLYLPIHWFSIFNSFNSFMVVIFLTGLVSVILMRTLTNNYAKYAREDDDLESPERDVSDESGWKLIHGDVFRTPRNLVLLSAVIRTGTQLAMLVLLRLYF